MRETSEGAETHVTTWVPKAPGGSAPGWLTRLRERVADSVWQPVWFKAASVALGMVGLSAIGMFSTLDGPRPVELAEPVLALGGMTQVAERAPPGDPAGLWLAGPDRFSGGKHRDGTYSDATRSDATHRDATHRDPTHSDPTHSDPTHSDPTHSDPTHSDPTHSDPTHSEGERERLPPAPTQTALHTTQSGDLTTEAQEAPREAAPGITADGKVILNTANAEELQRLPGVGQKRAESILALRLRLTRFKSPTDLLRVRGIGVKTLKKMLPHLVLDPPALEPPGIAPPAPGPSASSGLVQSR